MCCMKTLAFVCVPACDILPHLATTIYSDSKCASGTNHMRRRVRHSRKGHQGQRPENAFKVLQCLEICNSVTNFKHTDVSAFLTESALHAIGCRAVTSDVNKEPEWLEIPRCPLLLSRSTHVGLGKSAVFLLLHILILRAKITCKDLCDTVVRDMG